MNQLRRKKINRVITELNEIVSMLEDVKMDEEEALDNVPESLQETDKYIDYCSFLEQLADAIGYIEDAVEQLEL